MRQLLGPAFALLALLDGEQPRVELQSQRTGVTNRFIAVSAVSPTATRSALLLSAGNGAASKIFRTADRGATWSLVYTNPDSAGFYDCMDFFDADRGLVIGDSYDGKMAILSTTDGGVSWRRIPAERLPAPVQGEGGFASSGTCLTTRGDGNAWGVTTKGRVIHTADYGSTWSVSTAMTSTTDTVGLTSASFRDARNGFVFGGFGARASDSLVFATVDGGSTWTMRPRPPNGHGIWGGATTASGALIAVGPKGSAFSRDGARSWTQLDSVNYWGVGVAPGSNVAWAVGRGGRVTRMSGF